MPASVIDLEFSLYLLLSGFFLQLLLVVCERQREDIVVFYEK